MTVFPLYEDTHSHHLLGKSQLPFFIVKKTMHHDTQMHHHTFAELGLVTAGSGVEILNGRTHRIKRGTATFLLPHHIHEVHVEAPLQKYTCMFDTDILFSNPSDYDLGQLLLKTGSELPSHYDLSEEQTIAFSRILDRLVFEYNASFFAKDIIIRSKLMDAFVFLIRTQQKIDLDTVQFDDSEDIMEILHYIHVHYQEGLSLAAVAEQFGWNASYLSRVFKQSMGRTFTEYLHFLRIGRAASLLSSTNMKITDISVEVGFENTRTFNRVFKEIKGMTPTQFREYNKIELRTDSLSSK